MIVEAAALGVVYGAGVGAKKLGEYLQHRAAEHEKGERPHLSSMDDASELNAPDPSGIDPSIER
jgi:hypothetical protein